MNQTKQQKEIDPFKIKRKRFINNLIKCQKYRPNQAVVGLLLINGTGEVEMK